MRFNRNNHDPEEIKKIIRNLYFTSRFNLGQSSDGYPMPFACASIAFVIYPKEGFEGKDGKMYGACADTHTWVIQIDQILDRSKPFVHSAYNHIIDSLNNDEDEFEILGMGENSDYKEWIDEDVIEEINNLKSKLKKIS